ncbi:hypothetical protein ACQY0O_007337 [Thecaphora frezii]
MPGQFRLHPDPHERRHAEFKLGRSTFSTILHGWMGAACLIPHLTLPIYGVYWMANRFQLWPTSFEYGLAIAIALTEGLAAGAIVGLSVMRYGSTGKAIKGRRIENTASEEETKKQQRVEVALRVAIYVLLACIYWEYLVHSPYSPMTSAESRRTASGLMTSSNRIKDYLNNETLMPATEEAHKQTASVGANVDFDNVARQVKHTIDRAPKVHIGGPYKPKSEFLRAVEWATAQIRPQKTIGLVEFGPKTWK